MMKLSLRQTILLVCSLLSSGLHAELCGSTISSSCSITEPKSGKGPLYTIKDGASGTLTISAPLNALYRGSVLRFEGDSSKMNIVVTPEAKLSADYDVIKIEKHAKTGSFDIKGSITSRFQHALNIQPGSDYGKIVIDKGAVLISQSPYHPTIYIDNTSSGELQLDGECVSEKHQSLMYKTDPDHLWGEKKLPAGKHKVTAPKAAVALGDKNHRFVSDKPASYYFSDNTVLRLDGDNLSKSDKPLIEGTDIVFGKNSKLIITGNPPLGKPLKLFSASNQFDPPEVVSGNPFIKVVLDVTVKRDVNVQFVATSDDEALARLKSAVLSENQSKALLAQQRFGSEAVRNAINNLASDDASLKQAGQAATPELAYVNSIMIDMSRRTVSAIDDRMMDRSMMQTGVNTGDDSMRQSFWLRGSGFNSKLSEHNDDPGYTANTYAITFGYDRFLPDQDHLLGAAFAYQKSKADFSQGRHTDTDAWQLALYGNLRFPNYGLEPVAMYTRGAHKAERKLGALGDSADYPSNAYSLRLMAYWPLVVQPLAGINITHVSTDEHHFKILDQRIQNSSLTAYEAGAGLRFLKSYQRFSPKAQIMAWYNFSNDSLDTRYTIGNSPVMTVTPSRGKAPFSLSGFLGFDYAMEPSTLGCNASGIYREDFYDIGLSCHLRYEF